ncbi:substrate-binding domain-containing protein [Nesterenkonia sp. CF4.4]|uniref:substrate-binding domain-containing protein n=1 Tax=Nesterenkonia sp. CF4.4 TaxID=3373079 RepID=UPI003EE47DDA
MRESVGERRKRILDVLDHHDQVKVAHLAALLNVSMVTVRRDLESMTADGSVERRHGMVSRADGGGQPSADHSAAQGTIAIIAPERHSYLGAVTLGARKFLEHAGYRVVLYPTPNTANPERTILEEVEREGVDGVLLAPRWRTQAQENSAGAMLEHLKLPTVLLERRPDRHLNLPLVDSVQSDHWHGTHLAVEHLVTRGHRRILLAARQDSPTARTVNTAFAEIAAEHPSIDHWVTTLSTADAAGGANWVSDDATSELAFHQVTCDLEDPRWLSELVKEHRITAALIHSDENALVLSQRLTAAGIRVPEDCAIIAYDDVVAGLGRTPLTAVSPPKEAVGRVGAQLLSQRIRAGRSGTLWTPHRVELLPALIVRDST